MRRLAGAILLLLIAAAPASATQTLFINVTLDRNAQNDPDRSQIHNTAVRGWRATSDLTVSLNPRSIYNITTLESALDAIYQVELGSSDLVNPTNSSTIFLNVTADRGAPLEPDRASHHHLVARGTAAANDLTVQFAPATVHNLTVLRSALDSVVSALQSGTELANGISPSPLTYGKTYYVSTSGSDSNNGLSSSTPWRTVGHVNAQTFNPDDIILFNGGQTFGGGSAGLVLTTTVSAGPITIGSYGAGQLTISTGNSAACLTATNIPWVTINNVICTGGGNTTNTTAGISIVNSQAGNTKLAGPTISGVTVSGYGKNCIEVVGSNGSSGFNGWSIGSGTIAHDCTGNYSTSAASGSSCINVFAGPDYGSGYVTPAHTNFTIAATVYNCIGTAASANWSGSGITVFQSANYTITNSVAHDYGINSVSPGGIWTADGGNCVFSNLEVYNGNGATQNAYDFDGGTVNCHGFNLKAHNNTGSDFAAENYNDGTCCALWGNNSFSFSLGQNAAASELIVFFTAPATGPFNFYRNTLVSQPPLASLITQAGGSSAFNGTVANNIFVATGGVANFFVNLLHPSSLNFYGNSYSTYGQQANFAWNGNYYATLSAWQTATGQEKINGTPVGLFAINPQIYVPGGLFTTGGYFPAQDMADNLQSGSPMIGGGVSLAQFGITLPATDYYGAVVAANSQTIGAAEGDFATFVSSCTPATNYLARVSSFAKADNVNYNSLLCGANSDGDLSLVDGLWIEAAPNHAAAILNLVSSTSPIATLTEHGTCAFAARVGITGNGSTCYEDTGFNAATASGPNFTQNSGMVGDYNLTNGTTTVGEAESGFQATTSFAFLAAAGNEDGVHHGNAYCGVSEGGAGDGWNMNNTVTSGMLVCQRTAAAVATGYYNGAANLGTTEASAVNTGAKNLFLFAFSDTAGADQFSSFQHSADFIGAGTISVAHFSLRLNSFMQAYGINVY